MDRFIDHLLRIGPQASASGVPGFDATMLEQVRNSVDIIQIRPTRNATVS